MVMPQHFATQKSVSTQSIALHFMEGMVQFELLTSGMRGQLY